MKPFTVNEALSKATKQLSHLELPRFEAEVLLGATLNQSRAFLMSHTSFLLSEAEEVSFLSLIEKRKSGYPAAYLIGKKGFWTLDFKVTESTLIPRPETELLVELALGYLQGKKKPKILDLGTGSGAIALSLANDIKQAEVYATDYSFAALQVAQENARINNIHNVFFICADWLSAMSAKFDLIISNPPYIAEKDPHLSSDIRFEPRAALVSGIDGLKDIRCIVLEAKKRLRAGGCLMIEHGFDQAESVSELLSEAGYHEVTTHYDIGGHERVTLGIA